MFFAASLAFYFRHVVGPGMGSPVQRIGRCFLPSNNPNSAVSDTAASYELLQKSGKEILFIDVRTRAECYVCRDAGAGRCACSLCRASGNHG